MCGVFHPSMGCEHLVRSSGGLARPARADAPRKRSGSDAGSGAARGDGVKHVRASRELRGDGFGATRPEHTPEDTAPCIRRAAAGRTAQRRSLHACTAAGPHARGGGMNSDRSSLTRGERSLASCAPEVSVLPRCQTPRTGSVAWRLLAWCQTPRTELSAPPTWLARHAARCRAQRGVRHLVTDTSCRADGSPRVFEPMCSAVRSRRVRGTDC